MEVVLEPPERSSSTVPGVRDHIFIGFLAYLFEPSSDISRTLHTMDPMCQSLLKTCSASAIFLRCLRQRALLDESIRLSEITSGDQVKIVASTKS